MPFISFSPNTIIKSTDVNTNFTNAVHLTDAQKVSNKAMVPAITTDTDGATITFDMSTSPVHQVTLTANRILALSNVSVGQFFILRLIQDGSGSHTVTWFTTIKWAGGSAPTLTTTASKTDVLGFLCTSAGNYDGYIVGQGL